MSYHLRVLHSLVKLSRSNQSRSASSRPNDCSRSALLNRAGGSAAALGDALDTLVSLGLVQDTASGDEPLRLTLAGLAVGTAYAAEAARRAEEARAVEEPVRARRVVSAVRRERRAAPRTVASRAA